MTNINNELCKSDNQFDLNTVNQNQVAPKKAKCWRQVIGNGVGAICFGAAGTVLTSKHIATDVNTNDQVTDLSDAESAAEPVASTPVQSTVAAPVVAHNVTDDMTLAQAITTAREEVGPEGTFEWQGKVFGTCTPTEWQEMSEEEQWDFLESLEDDIVPVDDAKLEEMIRMELLDEVFEEVVPTHVFDDPTVPSEDGFFADVPNDPEVEAWEREHPVERFIYEPEVKTVVADNTPVEPQEPITHVFDDPTVPSEDGFFADVPNDPEVEAWEREHPVERFVYEPDVKDTLADNTGTAVDSDAVLLEDDPFDDEFLADVDDPSLDEEVVLTIDPNSIEYTDEELYPEDDEVVTLSDESLAEAEIEGIDQNPLLVDDEEDLAFEDDDVETEELDFDDLSDPVDFADDVLADDSPLDIDTELV